MHERNQPPVVCLQFCVSTMEAGGNALEQMLLYLWERNAFSPFIWSLVGKLFWPIVVYTCFCLQTFSANGNDKVWNYQVACAGTCGHRVAISTHTSLCQRLADELVPAHCRYQLLIQISVVHLSICHSLLWWTDCLCKSKARLVLYLKIYFSNDCLVVNSECSLQHTRAEVWKMKIGGAQSFQLPMGVHSVCEVHRNTSPIPYLVSLCLCSFGFDQSDIPLCFILFMGFPQGSHFALLTLMKSSKPCVNCWKVMTWRLVGTCH